MSIYYDRKKINKVFEFVIILLLVLSLVYAIGIIALSFSTKSTISIRYPENAELLSQNAALQTSTTANMEASVQKAVFSVGTVVASKKGTKYHLPTCSGAKTISSENMITFPSVSAAEKAGYSPAKNCKGLISPK